MSVCQVTFQTKNQQGCTWLCPSVSDSLIKARGSRESSSSLWSVPCCTVSLLFSTHRLSLAEPPSYPEGYTQLGLDCSDGSASKGRLGLEWKDQQRTEVVFPVAWSITPDPIAGLCGLRCLSFLLTLCL